MLIFKYILHTGSLQPPKSRRRIQEQLYLALQRQEKMLFCLFPVQQSGHQMKIKQTPKQTEVFPAGTRPAEVQCGLNFGQSCVEPWVGLDDPCQIPSNSRWSMIHTAYKYIYYTSHTFKSSWTLTEERLIRRQWTHSWHFQLWEPQNARD